MRCAPLIYASIISLGPKRAIPAPFSPPSPRRPAQKTKQKKYSLIAHLVERAQAAGCYKVILDCAEQNIGYYEKCGLARKEVQMVRYFDR
jgi:hypothetical protein